MNRKTMLWMLVVVGLIGAAWLVNIYVDQQIPRLARDMLARHFRGEVQLKSIHMRLLPTVRIRGEGLSILRASGTPFISVDRFSASTAVWKMLGGRRKIDHLKLDGLVVTIGPQQTGNPAASPRRRVPDLIIESVEAPEARLVIVGENGSGPAKTFELHQVAVQSAGTASAMRFQCRLRNALPPGEIDTHGDFGPWNFDDTGNTPVSGAYAFHKADLSVFKGISGLLSSSGSYRGTLDQIEVHGSADTPDFMVEASGHSVDLKTEFIALVDGTNGNTELKSVTAHFLDSTVLAKGGVYGREGVKGHEVKLEVSAKDAKVEDMLLLAAKNEPAMRGDLRFHANLDIPPGPSRFRDRMKVDGQASIENAFLTKQETRQKLASLSRRAQGEPGEVSDEDVPAIIDTRFLLADGILHVPGIQFQVPGMRANLSGTYALDDQQVNFSGVATLRAKPSEMTTGWKSFLLKLANPVFKGKKAGTVLPLKITGTRSDPKFRVRWGDLQKAKQQAGGMEPE